MDVDARLEALQALLERKEARIRQLEEAAGHGFLPPPCWGLTGAEARVFGVLLARELATKDAIMAALYRDVMKDEAEIKIVDVFVCKIRKKLQPFGIEILTRWGQGYQLSPAMKAAVRAQLGEAEAA